MAGKRRLIVGISGASGTIYGVRVLEALRAVGIETHLVMTKSAETTLAYETGLKVAEVHGLADLVHPNSDIGASISSGCIRLTNEDAIDLYNHVKIGTIVVVLEPHHGDSPYNSQMALQGGGNPMFNFQ